jgi:4-amino-4-deoxy-L-arabinose transferase-like glycosyltransferase
VLLVPVLPRWDGAIYARAAVELAAGRGYTWRILREGAPLVPTAFYPVGFPAWLAGLRLIGVTGAGALIGQALLGVLAVPIAWRLARRLGGRRAGMIAAWLAAIWPGGILYSAALLTEPLFMALVGIGTVIAIAARRRNALRTSAVLGVVLGLAAWVRPTALPIAFLLGASVARGRRAIGTSTVSFVIALLVISPWTLRNQHELGAPVLSSTNAGFNLLLGTVGRGAYGELPEGIDCDRSLDEVAKDRCRRALAFDRIASDPLAWLGRGLLKLADTFGHESTPAHYFADASGLGWLRTPLVSLTIPFWILTMLAAVAGARRARRRPALRIALAPIVAIAAVHFVFIGGDRYHAAVAPMILALAGVGLARRGGVIGRP